MLLSDLSGPQREIDRLDIIAERDDGPGAVLSQADVIGSGTEGIEGDRALS